MKPKKTENKVSKQEEKTKNTQEYSLNVVCLRRRADSIDIKFDILTRMKL